MAEMAIESPIFFFLSCRGTSMGHSYIFMFEMGSNMEKILG